MRVTKKTWLLTSSALALVLLAAEASKAYAAEQWPGGCGYPSTCQPPYACSQICIIGGSGDFCVTGVPGICG